MHSRMSRKGDAIHLEVKGKVDFDEVDSFRDMLLRALEEKPDSLLVDLRGCEYLSSMAIGVVIGLKIEASLKGTSLWVCRPTDSVRQLFALVGAEDALIRREG